MDYLTFALEGTEYLSTSALNFGWMLSPWIFTSVMRDVVSYLRNPEAVHERGSPFEWLSGSRVHGLER